MDVNETIVEAWLESSGFLVRRRLRYDLSGGAWSSVSDIDLLAYDPVKNKRIAVLVTAWMTQSISPSYFKAGTPLHSKLTHFSSPPASEAIRSAFGVSSDQKFERWFVVGRLGSHSKEAVANICQSFSITRVVEFQEVMVDLVEYVKSQATWLPQESEALQTIRALVWSHLL